MSAAPTTRKSAPDLRGLRLAGSGLAVLVAYLVWCSSIRFADNRWSLERVLRSHRPPGPADVVAVPFDRVGLTGVPPSLPRSPRLLVAAIVKRLSELRARTIVLEMMFTSKNDPAGDRELADAIRAAGNVVVARAVVVDPGRNTVKIVDSTIAGAAARIGYVVGGFDIDNLRQMLRPVSRVGDTTMNHLSVEAAAHFLGATGVVAGPGVVRLTAADPARERRIPVYEGDDPVFGGRVHFSEANNPRIPRVDLAELFDPARTAELAQRIGWKLVVVGQPATLISRSGTAGGAGATDADYAVAGLEKADMVLTSTLAQNVLSGGVTPDVARTLGHRLLPVFVLIALVFHRLPDRRGLALVLAAPLALYGMALVAFRHGHLVNWIAASAAVALAWGVQALTQAWIAARRAARIEQELALSVALYRQRLELSGTDPGPRPGLSRLGALVADFLPPRYADPEFLGEGGMGVVYRARDTVRGHDVAVKVLSPLVRENREAVQRFSTEAKTMQRLAHPGIVRVLDVELGVLPLFSMELLSGRTLDRVLADGPLEIERAVGMAIELAGALGSVHASGFIHRDLKPSNVMVTASGVKLLDFGLAKDMDVTRMTKTGDVLGTLRYMSPEQFRGTPCGPATDVYALAVVTCEMIAGRPPERGPAVHVLPRPALEGAGASAALVQVLERALAEDPAARPPDGTALATALTQVSSSGVVARP